MKLDVQGYIEQQLLGKRLRTQHGVGVIVSVAIQRDPEISNSLGVAATVQYPDGSIFAEWSRPFTSEWDIIAP